MLLLPNNSILILCNLAPNFPAVPSVGKDHPLAGEG